MPEELVENNNRIPVKIQTFSTYHKNIDKEFGYYRDKYLYFNNLNKT